MIDKFNVVDIDENLHRLIGVVAQVIEEFINTKGFIPNRVILSNKDFDLKGKVEVCGYKVFTSPCIPVGQAVVVTDEVVLDGLLN